MLVLVKKPYQVGHRKHLLLNMKPNKVIPARTQHFQIGSCIECEPPIRSIHTLRGLELFAFQVWPRSLREVPPRMLSYSPVAFSKPDKRLHLIYLNVKSVRPRPRHDVGGVVKLMNQHTGNEKVDVPRIDKRAVAGHVNYYARAVTLSGFIRACEYIILASAMDGPPSLAAQFQYWPVRLVCCRRDHDLVYVVCQQQAFHCPLQRRQRAYLHQHLAGES